MPPPSVPEGFPQYSLSDLKRMPAPKLLEIAEQLNISEGVARARKQDVIFALLKVLTRHGEGVAADGVLEILPDGFGFLRAAEASYLAGPDDTYISPSQIRRFNLRTGDHLSGRIRFPKDGERYFALSVVDTINGEPLEASKNKVLFENLTPLFPRRRFTLERGNGSTEDISGRILDLMAPQGKGQRALIVSPPKAGKTMMLQQVATAITHQPSGRAPDRAAHRRAPGRSDRNAAHRARRGDFVDLRRTRRAPRAGRRNGDRARQAPGRAQEGCRHPARLDHPPGPRLQQRRARAPARCSPAASTPTRCIARSVSSAPRVTSRKAVR